MKYNKLLRFLTVPLAVLFMVFAMGAGNVLAQSTIYVNDDTGDDATGDGTSANPYATIDHSITEAAEGDILSIAAGIYNEGGSQLDITKDITFVVTAYDGNTTLEIPNNVDVNAGETLSVNGGATIDAAITNNGTIDLTDAGATFIGDLTNPGTVELGTSTLEFSDALTLDNAGAIVSDDAGTIGDGEVLINASGETVAVANNGGELPNVTVAAGTFDLANNNVNIVGTYSQSGGTVTPGSATIDVEGDFIRTSGTFTAGTSTLTLSGSGDQELRPGGALTVNNLTIDNAGSTASVYSSFFAGGALTITSNSVLDLRSHNLRIDSGTGAIDVDGSYTGSGFLIVQSGGTHATTGGGTFGNLDIRNSSTVQLGSAVDLSGRLAVRDGTFDTNSNAFQLTTDNTQPSILMTDTGSFADTGGTGSVDVEAGETYDLRYEGSAGITAGTEWISADLNNLTIATDGQTVTGPGSGTSIDGQLTVQAGETLDLNAQVLTLASNSTEHNIVGTVSNGTVDFAGANVTVAGSTTGDDEATLNIVTVSETGAEIQNIQAITGAVTVNTNADLAIGLHDAGNAGEGEIGGAVTLNAGADGITFTSGVTVTAGGVDFDDGDADWGDNTITVTGGAVDIASAASVTGEGTLVLDGAGTFGTNGAELANVDVETAVTLISNVAVSGLLDQDADIANGGFDLTVSGTVEIVDGDNSGTFGGGGALVVTGADITAEDDIEISNLTIDGDDEATSVATDDEDNPRTVTVSTAFTHTSGSLSIGSNTLSIADGSSYTYQAGSYSMTDGKLQFLPATGAIAFDSNGETVSIANIEVDDGGGGFDVDLQANDELEITGMLELTDGDLDATATDANVVIGDGATIVRSAATGTLSEAPEFSGQVSLEYGAAMNTANEVPSDGDVLNFTDDSGADPGVALQDDVTASGVVTLNGGTDNTTAGVDFVLADNATLVVQDNAVFDADLSLDAEDSYNLTYEYDTTDPADISPSEFLSGATVDALTVNLGESSDVLRLDQDRAANDVSLDNGVLHLDDGSDPFDLTINGNLTFDGGTLESDFATSHLSIGGSSDSWINVIDGGITGGNIEVHLNKDSDDLTATITEGDLNLSNTTLHLESGMLDTEDDVAVVLGDPGFERDVADTVTTHVTGNVDKMSGTNAILMEFPTGSDDGKYRPATVTFTQDNPPITNTTIRVNHQNTKPQGSSGLPITDGDLSIEGWAPFYWAVSASPKLGVSQRFDLEFEAQEYEDEDAYEDVNDLRIIRRFEGDQDNDWQLQGGNYDNFEVDETTPIVRTIGSQGGLVNQTARFTIGIPTSGPLAPTFVSGPESIMLETIEGAEVDTTIAFDAEPASDTDEIVKYTLDGAPDYVSIDTTNGDVNISMTAAEADTLSSSFSITAEDNNGRMTSMTVALEVVIAVDIDEPVAALPKKFELDGNYPNPFNPTTNIQFDLPAHAQVSIEIYNTLGQRVMMIPAHSMQAGAAKTVQVDASSLSSGMYLYRVIAETAENQMVKGGKMMLMK